MARDAFTLTTPDQAGDIKAIERFIGQKVPQLQLEGFNYGATPRPAMGFQGAAPSHGQHGQRPQHGGRGGGGGGYPPRQQQRPQSSSQGHAPRPAQSGQHAPQGQGHGGGGHGQQHEPRKFGGLSRGRWGQR